MHQCLRKLKLFLEYYIYLLAKYPSSHLTGTNKFSQNYVNSLVTNTMLDSTHY